MPSYLGSKVHPAPGTSLPTLAYIGSRTPALVVAASASDVLDCFAEAAARFDATTLDFAATLDFGASGNFLDALALGSRLLCQTLLFPAAISSIVRPVSTDVMLSATTSSSVAYSSRCLIRSHCGLEDEDASRENFMRIRAKDPCSRSPWKVIFRSPRLRPSRIASSSSSGDVAASEE